jgi:hypothetical protein
MIEAGSETTSMQLNNMLIGVLSNPETIARAHEELDRVIGSDRPPTFDDVPKLPYINAMVKVFCPSIIPAYFLGNHEMASNQQVRSESFRNSGNDSPFKQLMSG